MAGKSAKRKPAAKPVVDEVVEGDETLAGAEGLDEPEAGDADDAEPDDEVEAAPEAKKPLPKAKVVDKDPQVRDAFRGIKIGTFFAVLFVGWLFVLGSNNFHVTAPTVFVCLGYFAILMTVVNLWRTGAAAVAPDAGEAWARPIGARGALEKEKKTLLKAIKEAEFDLAMGKLSQVDADSLIRDYRARAIEVIKELDHSSGKALTPAQEIEREVKARIALDAVNKPSKRAKNAIEAKEKAEAARRERNTPKAKPDVKPEVKAEEAAVEAAASEDSKPAATGDHA